MPVGILSEVSSRSRAVRWFGSVVDDSEFVETMRIMLWTCSLGFGSVLQIATGVSSPYVKRKGYSC
jgi:hypothetical protein